VSLGAKWLGGTQKDVCLLLVPALLLVRQFGPEVEMQFGGPDFVSLQDARLLHQI
jgi:hypothetical protein